MKLFRVLLVVVPMLVATPLLIHAQSGCSDSPEAPTEVLMLVGSIGMMYGSSVTMKALRRFRKK